MSSREHPKHDQAEALATAPCWASTRTPSGFWAAPGDPAVHDRHDWRSAGSGGCHAARSCCCRRVDCRAIARCAGSPGRICHYRTAVDCWKPSHGSQHRRSWSSGPSDVNRLQPNNTNPTAHHPSAGRWRAGDKERDERHAGEHVAGRRCLELPSPRAPRHSVPLARSRRAAPILLMRRYWLPHPTANLATITDERVGVIELHHPAKPDALLRALKDHHADQAPMFHAGQGVMYLLVKPDLGPDQSALEIASHRASDIDRVVITPPGTLVLLPPSRHMTGRRIRWMSHLHHVERLPTAAHMLEILTGLRKNGVLNELLPMLAP